jgi:hypothetical protein
MSQQVELADPLIYEITFRCGLGDTLMQLSAMEQAAKRLDVFPLFDVRAFAWHEVFEGLPFIRNVGWLGEHDPEMSSLQFSHFVDAGADSLSRYPYRVLGIDDIPLSERRIPYVLRPEEKVIGAELLVGAGWKGERVLFIQTNGSLTLKFWRENVRLAEIARSLGWFVVWTGDEHCMTGSGYLVPDGPGSLLGKVSGVRNLAGVLANVDCVVGFDSGLSYLAAALDTPVVILCGPIDASVLMNGVGAHTRWRMIRHDWAYACFALHGQTCRNIGPIVGAGPKGDWCPLRGGRPGADCVDSIRAETVWAAVVSLVSERKSFCTHSLKT